MNTQFNSFISEHGFEEKAKRYFSALSPSGVDYFYAYSLPNDIPCLYIDFDNCTRLSRITLLASGECSIEVISFKNGEQLIHETSELRGINEFEDKLFSLIEYMKASHTLH